MEIKTFWLIVLKAIGLLLLLNCLYIFPQITATLLTTPIINGWSTAIPDLAIGALVFIIYLLLVFLFIFKPNVLISKLNLEKHFSETQIDISVSAETVLKIIIILIGGMTLLSSFPNLVKEIFEFAQHKELLRNSPNLTWLSFYFVETILGFLLILNSSAGAKFITRQSKK